MSDRYEFQGLCLVNQAGHRFMCSHYDHLPPDIRQRLQDSPFNICAACVTEQSMRRDESHEAIILMMENTIRKEDADAVVKGGS